MDDGTYFSKSDAQASARNCTCILSTFYFSVTATVVSDFALVKIGCFVLICVSHFPFTFRLCPTIYLIQVQNPQY